MKNIYRIWNKPPQPVTCAHTEQRDLHRIHPYPTNKFSPLTLCLRYRGSQFEPVHNSHSNYDRQPLPYGDCMTRNNIQFVWMQRDALVYDVVTCCVSGLSWRHVVLQIRRQNGRIIWIVLNRLRYDCLSIYCRICMFDKKWTKKKQI